MSTVMRTETLLIEPQGTDKAGVEPFPCWRQLVNNYHSGRALINHIFVIEPSRAGHTSPPTHNQRPCSSLGNIRRRCTLRYLCLPPRRLIHIIEVHRHTQEPHVHIRLIRQISKEDLKPCPKRRAKLA